MTASHLDSTLHEISRLLASRDVEDSLSRTSQRKGYWADAMRSRRAACTAHRDALRLAREIGIPSLPADLRTLLLSPPFKTITDSARAIAPGDDEWDDDEEDVDASAPHNPFESDYRWGEYR